MTSSPGPATDGGRARQYHRLRFALSAVELALSIGYLVALLATGASAISSPIRSRRSWV